MPTRHSTAQHQLAAILAAGERPMEYHHLHNMLKYEGQAYKIVVRCVLWVIVWSVFLGFAIWWAVT